MARNKDDASGTVWVHDPPQPGGDASAPGPPPLEHSLPPDAAVAPSAAGAAPVVYDVPAEPASRGVSTGCLVLLFAMGGIGLGVAILFVFALGGGIVYSMQVP